MRGLPDLEWVFKHFYCDLDKYCCNPIYGDQKSWVQTHNVTAGVGGFIGDIVTLFGLPWNGFVEVSPKTIGSFTYKVDMSIDCAKKTKSLTITVYNTWSVASLTRNPVTGQPLANSGLNPVDIIVEMKNEDVSVPTGWFTRLMWGCLW